MFPQYKGYFTGQQWAQVAVRLKKNAHRPVIDSLIATNPMGSARLVAQPDMIIEVKPNTGWGLYFLIKEVFAFIIFFVALWYLIRVLEGFKSENNFQNRTVLYLLRLGQVLFFVGIFLVLDKYFINWYILEQLEFVSYKISSDGGAYLLFGALLIYISNYYKKGLVLQTENELTV